MKNLFAEIYDEKTKTTVLPIDEFKVKEPSEELQKEIESIWEEGWNLSRASSMSLLQLIVWLGSSLGAVVFMAIFFMFAKNSTLIDAAKNYLWCIIAFAVCLSVSLITFAFQYKKKKAVDNSVQMRQHKEQEKQLERKIKEEFSVPENAPDIDVVSVDYEIKNGTEKKCFSGTGSLLKVAVFVVDDKLYMLNSAVLYAIPVSCITATYEVRKKFPFFEHSWNKEKPINSPEYKGYLKKDSNYDYSLKYYYSVRLSCPKGEFEIIVPPYDIHKLAAIVNLKGVF